MNDPQGPARLDVRKAHPPLWKRLSLVWLVPVLALIVTLGVAWQSYADRGILITIAFQDGQGIKAGETVVKYRDIEVGMVESVAFDPGLQDVLVSARIDKQIAPFLDQDAFFWVVAPDVSLRGVTGLETVLSGVYIQGTWNNMADNAQTEFRGLETAPLDGGGDNGTIIRLRARDASALSAGAPVLHKGIQVGYLQSPELSTDGDSVVVDAFIEFPYDQRITTATRFWDTSGFSINVGAAGLSVNVNSLASLIEGGIAFDTVVSGGERVSDNALFDIFTDELTASESLFNDPDSPTADVAVRFNDNVAGLRRGSDVNFGGIRVGQVKDISAIVVEGSATTTVELQAILGLEPGRLGLGEDATPQEAVAFLETFVAEGLRARLITGNILSGALTVELIKVENARPATLIMDAGDYPVIPNTANVITDVADTAQGVLNRINDLPIEELLQSAINLMDSIDSLARDDNLRALPVSTVGLLDDLRALVGSADVQAIPVEARAVVSGVQQVVNDIAAAQIANLIVETLDNANALAGNLSAGTENLPAVSAELEALTAKVNALDLEGLIAQASQTLAVISGFVGSDEAKALPPALTASLDEATALIAEARSLVASDDLQAIPGDLRGSIVRLNALLDQATTDDLIGKLNATLDSAQQAAANVNDATTGLPGITAELEKLAAQARGLELDKLVAEATTTLNSIDTLIGSQSTQDIPASLTATLDELRLFLAEVREGGAINNVNAALASANEAARAIEEAAASLPALAAQADRLLRQTDSTLAGFAEGSRFNAETLSTLRDIQEAADAVSSLARAIQRNPNSLLTGR